MIFQTYNFSQVEVVLIDTQVSNLRLVRSVLDRMGIKKVHPFLNMSGVMESVVASVPDLLLIDADDAEGEALKFVRWLRTDINSPNPFMCVIATTWQPTTTLFNRVTNSGVDDLLVSSISSKQIILDRVNSLIYERRKFIVTADYIGPDRRKTAREETPSVPMLDAPNILQMKVTGQWKRLAEREQIASAMVWVNTQKTIRDAIQIAILVEFAAPGLLQTPPERQTFDHLLRILGFIEDLQRRLVGHPKEESISINCKNIQTLIEQMCSTQVQSVAESNLDQIKTLILNLMCTLSPDRSPEDLSSEVANFVAAYRIRLAQQVSDKAAQLVVEPFQPFPVKR